MNLNVFVGERRVAMLTSPDGFEHVLAYLPEATSADFVSLAMPVAQGAWHWPTLHPFFQVSLPEGFLLSVLKEQLGPHLGATPLELLSVVGHNMIGRVRVSAGQTPAAEAALDDLSQLLHGEHSKAAFMVLLGQYSASGVSGVVPKFLTPRRKRSFARARSQPSVTSSRPALSTSPSLRSTSTCACRRPRDARCRWPRPGCPTMVRCWS
jgi:serine/threonine-protein kinase HipA